MTYNDHLSRAPSPQPFRPASCGLGGAGCMSRRCAGRPPATVYLKCLNNLQDIVDRIKLPVPSMYDDRPCGRQDSAHLYHPQPPECRP